MIVTYFVPIGLMGFTYAMIGQELWGSQSIGECTQRQLEHIKSKRRVSFFLINLSASQILISINDIAQLAVQLKWF